MFLFPAHAGVIPHDQNPPDGFDTIPRTRGGDPASYLTDYTADDYSPHTRG